MTKFIANIVVIEAYRIPQTYNPEDENNKTEWKQFWAWARDNASTNQEGKRTLSVMTNMETGERVLQIGTLEGDMIAQLGDWIIVGLIGEIYPCKNEVFIKKYRPYIPPKDDEEGEVVNA